MSRRDNFGSMADLTDMTDPRAVVLAALTAHAAMDWQRLVVLMDAASLAEAHEFDVERNYRIRSMDELREAYPGASTQWLAGVADQERRRKQALIDRLPEHWGVDTVDELRALPPADHFILRLARRHPRRPLASEAGLKRVVSGNLGPFRVVGVDDLTSDECVVTVTDASDAEARFVAARVVRRQPDGTWRVVATAESFALPG